jgi:hypothetical protein
LIPITPFDSSQKLNPQKKIYGVEFGGEEVMIVDDDVDSASKGLGFRVFSSLV